MLVNVEEYEIRVAFMENGNLADLFIEKKDDRSRVGNLYKGVVEDVVPSLQAAFIDIGQEKRAFLHFNDFCLESLNPAQRDKRGFLKKIQNLVKGKTDNKEKEGNPSRKDMNDPAKVLQKGQNILVQVAKDEIGKKGPRVRTDIAIPGRYLVLLPYPSQKGGISRRIENEKERQRLKKILGEIKTSYRSFIIRTAGEGTTDESIKSDIGQLKRTWTRILRRYRQKSAPCLLFNDHDMLYRIIRDNFTDDIEEIIVDDRDAFRQMKKILKNVIPPLADKVRFFFSSSSMFSHHDVEKQIKKACRRKVWLKSGGYIVFDETEALVAIDVNSGRFTGKQDQEKVSLRTNIEAARTIAVQIRLRDIGGIIVIDFIDMEQRSNQKAVENEFRRSLMEDKAKFSVLPISEFGLLQLTRKRVRHSLVHQVFNRCPYCGGTGFTLSPNQIWREMKYSILELLQKKPKPKEITVVMHPCTKEYIEEKMAKSLDKIEKQFKVPVTFFSSEDLHIEDYRVRYTLPEK